MVSISRIRKFAIAAALFVGAPVVSFAQFAIAISVHTAPPPLPVYVQPPFPAEGYIWTPGYWAYGDDAGYYWVPGVWVQPPTIGVLWTPPYWGFEGGVYGFHAGYWGPHVGFYGGVNYGFGYGGVGYGGGLWVGGRFSYNSAVNNFGGVHVSSVYVNRTVINNTVVNHASFNGPGGYQARPTPTEQQAMHEQHMQPTGAQQQHFQTAASNPAQRFSANGGRPAVTAARTPEAFRQQSVAANRAAAPSAAANRGGFGNTAAPNRGAYGNSAASTQAAPISRPVAQEARPTAQPREQAVPRQQAAPKSAPRQSEPKEEKPKK
jgi:hypothetical protein